MQGRRNGFVIGGAKKNLRNYVYMFVDFEKKFKNTTINIDYSLYLPNYSVTHMFINSSVSYTL